MEETAASGKRPAPSPTVHELTPGAERRRRRWVGLGAAMALLGLAAVCWVYVWCSRDESGRGPNSTSLVDPDLLDPDNPLQAEAVTLADQLVTDFPDDVEAMFLCGLLLNKFVSRDEAARCWRECLQRDPGFAQPYYWLGKELFKKGEYEQAVGCLRRAVELDVPMPDARIQLADALINVGRPAEAVPILEEQVRVAPGVTAGFFYLAQAYFLLGKLDEAVEHYQRALDLNPECHQAWHGLAMISRKRGQMEKAREYSEKLRQYQATFHADHRADKQGADDADTLEGTLATAYTDAGRIYLARNRVKAAEACWVRAAAVDPQNAGSRMLLVDLYRYQERLEPVVPLLEQLSRIQPDNPIHFFNLGVHQMTLGQFEQAEEALARVIEMAPQRAEGYAALGSLYVRNGRELARATELARKAVELEPAAEYYFLLSRACAKNDDRPAAIAAIARAVELDPGNPEYRRFQAQFQGPSTDSP